jgi:hypothetical protein
MLSLCWCQGLGHGGRDHALSSRKPYRLRLFVRMQIIDRRQRGRAHRAHLDKSSRRFAYDLDAIKDRVAQGSAVRTIEAHLICAIQRIVSLPEIIPRQERRGGLDDALVT